LKQKAVQVLSYSILICSVLFILIPLWMMITGSLMGKHEVTRKMGVVLEVSQEPVSWTILPNFPTLQPYVELLLDSPKFFVMFWNSVKQVIPIILGQLFISVMAAWGFARYDFKGKKPLFLLYIILMIMPFQVTMVSSYLVLDAFHLLDSHYAIIIPGVFSTFPIFIMTKFFKSIPEELIESAKLDGARRWTIFIRIGLPLGSSGIISMVILSFLEYWNALEQPLTFLKDKTNWPLSLYLPQISSDNIGVSFIASLVMMLPAVCIFLRGQTYLEQGIVASGIKQ
jgi:multiple sugar transport system permease protein